MTECTCDCGAGYVCGRCGRDWATTGRRCDGVLGRSCECVCSDIPSIYRWLDACVNTPAWYISRGPIRLDDATTTETLCV